MGCEELHLIGGRKLARSGVGGDVQNFFKMLAWKDMNTYGGGDVEREHMRRVRKVVFGQTRLYR